MAALLNLAPGLNAGADGRAAKFLVSLIFSLAHSFLIAHAGCSQANSSNDPELLRRAKSLLQHFKLAYGLCFTLTRVDQEDSTSRAPSPEEEEEEEEPPPPGGSAEEQPLEPPPPTPAEVPADAPAETSTGEYTIESTGETIREPIDFQEKTAVEATEIAMEAAKQVAGAELFSGPSGMMEPEDTSKEALEQKAEDALDVLP
ncbi:hypothetical protein CYMTET_7064 [Cymbomonas tetramitiformis]|uniref:Uncharacterized protein n=1 Tax=Cymbomonas tetramitiformis TaxID=36881 RepID=A0AAE0LH93_9CHLO|nr:hypothetical protein CYMTET_7064 [Cymbomonas tetramitiformis]